MLQRPPKKTGFSSPLSFALPTGALEIYDLLQLSRQEHEAKRCCRFLLSCLSSWKRENPRAMPAIAASFFDMRGMLLRQQARKAVTLYRLIRVRRRQCFNAYISRLPVREIPSKASDFSIYLNA